MSDRYFNRDRNRPYDNDFDDDFFDRDFNRDWNNRNYGDWRGTMNRRLDFGRGNYGAGGRGQGRGMTRASNRGFGGQGYESEFYDRDFGGYGRGYGGRFGDYNRGSGSYGRGYGSSRLGDYSTYGRGSGFGRQDYGYGQQGGYFEDEFDMDYDDEPTWIYEEEIWLIPGPFSGIGPEDYHRSDERIREDILDRLTQHGQIDARKMHVEVQNGEVTLTGEVNSREAKRMCEDVVDSVFGVRDVHNQLRVKDRHQQGQLTGQQQGQMSGQSQSFGQQGQQQQSQISGQQQGQRNRQDR